MGYRELVRRWNEGVLALEKGDRESALNIFRSIADPTSKIDFNIGSLHLLRGELERALEAFDQTVSKDNRLAVGFFQRGYVCLQLERYEEALNDCRLALAHLRKNPCIDYKQLGLKVVLCAWEVLYNTAAAQCRLGRWQEAQWTLEEAAGHSRGGQIPQLDTALEQVQAHLFLEPRSVPPGEIFRPPTKVVDELEEKDFLGRPKVISSAFEEDNLRGFRSLQPQKVINRVPPPPAKAPPNWPRERPKIQKPGPTEGNTGRVAVAAGGADPERALEVCSAQGGAAHVGTRPVLLKVHGSYTVDMKVSITPSLGDLGALLQEECRRQAAQMTLSYRPPESDELIPINSDEELRTVWQEAQGSHLTLWCQGKEESLDRAVLYRMVARHPYAGQAQEDLNFKEGDTLEVLSEVNKEWLEGRCNGAIGIFPKCFAVREDANAAWP